MTLTTDSIQIDLKGIFFAYKKKSHKVDRLGQREELRPNPTFSQKRSILSCAKVMGGIIFKWNNFCNQFLQFL